MSLNILEVKKIIPFMRRYARATMGSTEAGDQIAEHALIAVFRHENGKETHSNPRLALFRAMQDMRAKQIRDQAPDQAAARRHVDESLAALPQVSRDAYLLRAFEQFSDREIAKILGRQTSEIGPLIVAARHSLSNMITRKILIIEDELCVAQEISDIVTGMGHCVIGNAPTKEDAVEIAECEEPDLIMSDIQLARSGSGIQAVNAILKLHPLTPVVYVTGFPERLLTGKGPEPAFLVTKPYTSDQVRTAVSQAMFFA